MVGEGSSRRSCQRLRFSTLSMRITALSHQRCANWHRGLLHAQGVERSGGAEGRVAVLLGPHAVCQEHVPVEVQLEIARHSMRHADRRALHLAGQTLGPGTAEVMLGNRPPQRLVDGVGEVLRANGLH